MYLQLLQHNSFLCVRLHYGTSRSFCDVIFCCASFLVSTVEIIIVLEDQNADVTRAVFLINFFVSRYTYILNCLLVILYYHFEGVVKLIPEKLILILLILNELNLVLWCFRCHTSSIMLSALAKTVLSLLSIFMVTLYNGCCLLKGNMRQQKHHYCNNQNENELNHGVLRYMGITSSKSC